MSDSDRYTKTLGIEWNASSDHFRVRMTELPPIKCMTKRSLISDIAKTLGWYSPAIVKTKVLLQTLWLEGIGWDDCVPNAILENGRSGDKNCHYSPPTVYHDVVSPRKLPLFTPSYMGIQMLRRRHMLPPFTSEWKTLMGRSTLPLLYPKPKLLLSNESQFPG